MAEKTSKRKKTDGEVLLPLPGMEEPAAEFCLRAVATAEQLFPITGMSDMQLRNLANTNDPEGKPWIPKPALGKWNTRETLAGLRRYLQHKADRAEELPTYASMEVAEARAHLPKEMLQYAKRKGSPGFPESGRVELGQVLRFFKPLLVKIFAGGNEKMAGLEEFEGLNLDAERAKVAQEEFRKKKRENDVADGLVHERHVIEEIVWEKGLGPIRAELLAFARQNASACNPDNPSKAQDALEKAVNAMMKRVRDALPAKRLKLTSESPQETAAPEPAAATTE